MYQKSKRVWCLVEEKKGRQTLVWFEVSEHNRPCDWRVSGFASKRELTKFLRQRCYIVKSTGEVLGVQNPSKNSTYRLKKLDCLLLSSEVTPDKLGLFKGEAAINDLPLDPRLFN